MNNLEHLEKSKVIIHSTALLLLAILANFVGEMIPCEFRHLIHTNMVFKHLIIFCLIYFTISMNTEAIVNPQNKIISTLKIYMLFLFFTKQNLLFSIISFGIMFSLLLLHDYVKYYQHKQNNILTYKYSRMSNRLVKLLVFVLCCGLIQYFFQHQHVFKFNISSFFIGSSTYCHFK